MWSRYFKLTVILFFVFVCTLQLSSQSQNNEKYFNVIDTKNDSVKIDHLEHNLLIALKLRETQVVNDCFDELLVLVEKTKNGRLIKRLVLIVEANFTSRGNYRKSLDYYFRIKSVADKLNFNFESGDVLDAIGVTYWLQGDYTNALVFYKEALSKKGKLATPNDLQGAYNNMGLVYRRMGDYKKALEFYTKSLQICVRNKITEGSANAYSNIGALYQIQKDYYKALYFNEKALALRKQTRDSVGIAISLGNIGSVHLDLENYKEAEPFLIQSYNISTRLNDLEGVKEMSEGISRLYDKTNKPVEALVYYKKFIATRDSLNNEASQQEALRKEMEFKFQQEEQKKSIERTAEKKRQQLYTYMVLVILGIVIVFSILLYRRFNLTKKQKSIIEQQKKFVEEKQKEITDSIHYAKRIQTALMPSDKYLEKNISRLIDNQNKPKS